MLQGGSVRRRELSSQTTLAFGRPVGHAVGDEVYSVTLWCYHRFIKYSLDGRRPITTAAAAFEAAIWLPNRHRHK